MSAKGTHQHYRVKAVSPMPIALVKPPSGTEQLPQDELNFVMPQNGIFP
jgi:hypothetical protein